MSVKLKEVKPVKLSLLCVVRLFQFCYFHCFRHSERGIKSLRLEVTFIKILHWSALIPVLFTDLTFSAFAWTNLSDLDDSLDWGFVKKVWPRYGHTSTDVLMLMCWSAFQRPHYPCILYMVSWNINGLWRAPRYGRQRLATLDGEANFLLGRVCPHLVVL